MMHEHRVIRIGECADFQEGYVNPKQGTPDYFDGPIKWLRAVDLNDGEVRSTSRTLTEVGFNSAGKSALLFEPETIAISKSGTIGRLGILKDYMCRNRAVINIKPRPNVCDTRFFFYALKANRAEIISRAEGSVQKNLYISALSSIEIEMPPLQRQREIAATLGALDDKIELNRRTAATLEEMARGLYRSWFVDFEPVHAKAAGRAPAHMNAATAALFPDGFGEDGLPEGWHSGTLAEVAHLNARKHSKKEHPAQIEYVDLANTKWGTIEATAKFQWNDAPSRARMSLAAGDTIVGTVRPGNGSFSFVSKEGLTGSTGFAVLSPKDDRYASLVCLAATDPATIEILANLADGGAYPAVRPEVVAAREITLAPEDLLVAFSAEVSPLIAKIEAGKEENQTLAALRDALLPRLMSGELRVGEAKEQVEAVA